MKLFKYSYLLSIILLIAGCGDSGGGDPNAYNGVTTPTEINDTNAKSIVTAVVEGTSNSIAADEAPSYSSVLSHAFSNPGLPTVAQKAIEYLTSKEDLPVGVAVDGVCTTGSLDVSTNNNQTSATLSYSNCGYSGAVIDGRVIVSISGTEQAGSISIAFENFSITYEGEIHSFAMLYACDYDYTSGLSFECTYSADFIGSDDRHYRIENYSISTSWNVTDGYLFSGTIYDPDHGAVEVSTDVAIVFGTCGHPISGQMTITASNKTATVVFNSCTDFTVTIDGVATIYNW